MLLNSILFIYFYLLIFLLWTIINNFTYSLKLINESYFKQLNDNFELNKDYLIKNFKCKNDSLIFINSTFKCLSNQLNNNFKYIPKFCKNKFFF